MKTNLKVTFIFTPEDKEAVLNELKKLHYVDFSKVDTRQLEFATAIETWAKKRHWTLERDGIIGTIDDVNVDPDSDFINLELDTFDPKDIRIVMDEALVDYELKGYTVQELIEGKKTIWLYYDIEDLHNTIHDGEESDLYMIYKALIEQ